jgi:hypothetical protein
MKQSLFDKVYQALRQAENHNSSIMVKPEVILWPDPERQWEEVIPALQEDIPQLLIYGSHNPEKRQGPAIWIKCMVAKVLPEATWDNNKVPVIYLPGVSKGDLRNVEHAGLDFQPLLEYQYTGTLFLQENGKEWTVLAFLENIHDGYGLKVVKDNATKSAIIKSLPLLFRDKEVFSEKTMIVSDFLNSYIFPDVIPSILKWMCKGPSWLSSLDSGKLEVFTAICNSQYGFYPDYKNIKEIAEKLGTQKNVWKQVWQFYATAPGKFPEIEELLRLAKPADLGTGIFGIPRESWPQINEEMENALRNDLQKLAKKDLSGIITGLKKLQLANRERLSWVWKELGYSPLLLALQYLANLSESVNVPYPSATVKELVSYYTTSGYEVDTAMRKAFTSVKTQKDKIVVSDLIRTIYKPWLENLTVKFQNLITQNSAECKSEIPSCEEHPFYLFVDAFRYDAAREFEEICRKRNFKTELSPAFSAFPTLTSTAKVKASPVSNEVSNNSDIKDFTPQFKSGKYANIVALREELEKAGYCHSIKKGFDPDKKYWVEIGSIDTYGHDEQAEMLRRMDDLFGEIIEIISIAKESGAKTLKIVTDHGWLMLPGGLPAEKMVKDLTVARCGRCALIKEGVKTEFTQLPWEWNPITYVAYAPGISFFRNNEEYAHGGISLQECVIPELTITIEQKEQINAKIKSAKWVNLRCNIETENSPDGFKVDIRTRYNDEGTSVVLSGKQVIESNKCSLLVDDSALDSAAFLVLTDDNGMIIDKINTTIGN